MRVTLIRILDGGAYKDRERCNLPLTMLERDNRGSEMKSFSVKVAPGTVTVRVSLVNATSACSRYPLFCCKDGGDVT
jgi:hypothetical protein